MISRDYRALKVEMAESLAGQVSEVPPPDPHGMLPINERLVQLIWREQLIAGDRLRTRSGRTVRVLDPGRWNHADGPDFRTAELELDGRVVRGDIEIHLDAAEWKRHAHDRDFEYNGCVLHVSLRQTDGAKTDTLQNGATLERLLLEDVLEPDLDTIRRSLTPEEEADDHGPERGFCTDAVNKFDKPFLRRFFATAARARMEARIQRLAHQVSVDGFEQALYQSLMTSLGHKGGRSLYFLLAKRTPVEELRRYFRGTTGADLQEAVEATLLHTANLVPTAGAPASAPARDHGSALPDPETIDYLNRINGWWTRVAGYFQDRLIPPTNRWNRGIRPVSFPARRLSGLASVLAARAFQGDMVANLASGMKRIAGANPKTVREFQRAAGEAAGLLTAQAETYWSYRYTLGGRRLARPTQLIGEDLARSLAFNALLPAMILHARQQKDADFERALWTLHENFPRLAENAITRHMRHRLFGGESAKEVLSFRIEWHQQALIHVYYDCCGNAARNTGGCLFQGTAP